MLKTDKKQHCANRGYTLLEILVVLAIVAILAMLTVPAFQDTIQRNAREAAMLSLMTALSYARSEAVTQGRAVSLCRSTDQATCAGGSGGDWNDGWIVFSDIELLQAQGAGNDQNTVRLGTVSGSSWGTPQDVLVFDFEGFMSTPSMTAWFRFCSRDNSAQNTPFARVENTGRAVLVAEPPAGVTNVCP